jgi:uncharacterized membrane protein
MESWFLTFLIYSFLGYCLEKAYAHIKRSPRKVRKCFLLLPLCPVYGLAMTALLALTGEDAPLWVLLPLGALVCTGTEYLVHLLYDRALHVRFWDYRGLRGNLNGRVCPRFALYWGALSALAVKLVQPWVTALAHAIPWPVVYGLWLVFAIDSALSCDLLWRYHDTELLSLRAVYQRTQR